MNIDREKLKTFSNILSLNNKDVNLNDAYQVLTCYRDKSLIDVYELLLSLIDNSQFSESYHQVLRGFNNQDPETIHSALFALINSTSINTDINDIDNIIHTLKKQDSYNFWVNLFATLYKDLDLELLTNVIQTIKHNEHLETDILDSFSANQISAKTALLEAVNNLNILDKNSIVVVFGSWYSSILTPLLANKVKHIVNFDLDQLPLRIAKNNFFKDYDNVSYICDDVFKTYRDVYLDTNLIINTSCEHMPPMKEWPWFQKGALETDSPRKHKFGSPKLSSNCYFAFQSNNMFGIEGHINCVNNIEEFKDQLPERAEVLYEEEVEDTRGTRYMLVGKFNSI